MLVLKVRWQVVCTSCGTWLLARPELKRAEFLQLAEAHYWQVSPDDDGEDYCPRCATRRKLRAVE